MALLPPLSRTSLARVRRGRRDLLAPDQRERLNRTAVTEPGAPERQSRTRVVSTACGASCSRRPSMRRRHAVSVSARQCASVRVGVLACSTADAHAAAHAAHGRGVTMRSSREGVSACAHMWMRALGVDAHGLCNLLAGAGGYAHASRDDRRRAWTRVVSGLRARSFGVSGPSRCVRVSCALSFRLADAPRRLITE